MSAPAWLKSFAGSAKKKPKLNCTAAASDVAVAHAGAAADYMAEELLQVLCKTRTLDVRTRMCTGAPSHRES